MDENILHTCPISITFIMLRFIRALFAVSLMMFVRFITNTYYTIRTLSQYQTYLPLFYSTLNLSSLF